MLLIFIIPKFRRIFVTARKNSFRKGFLRELFVKVLGYTLNSQPNYNLITEKKNEKDSQKTDGTILINGEANAVIERP
jgi:hypothetical protein